MSSYISHVRLDRVLPLFTFLYVIILRFLRQAVNTHVFFLSFILVNEGKACQDSVCELRLGNYSRNDPAIIECVADNEKSTRISKIFHVDVYCKLNFIKKLLTQTFSIN